MAVDATDQTFATDVLERSKQVPVLVDFWAEWCGPCRQLTPVLETAVAATDGAVELVKVDVDASPQTAVTYGIQGIPAVKAFRDGRIVDEFTGAVSPAVVEAFLRRLMPSEADHLVELGDEASLRRALELEPGNVAALAGLARFELAEDPRVATALDAIRAGDTERGLQMLLDAVIAAQGEMRDRIRQVMVGVLTDLGQDHPLAREYRRRLASALY